MTFQHYLNICHWNIQGLKLNNSDKSKVNETGLTDLVRENDIICLCETHCGQEEDLSYNGYSCFKLCRKRNKKINRYFGGIAIIYKNTIKEGIKFLTHSNDDYIWIKLCKTYFGLECDLYLCYAYIPPANSEFYKNRQDDTWDYIENDIAKYSHLGSVILCGDLNARTGRKNDFVDQDEQTLHSNDLYYELDNDITRNSQDTVICARGRKLIDTCISANLRIVNGRKLGDNVGRFTCHKSNGSSTVDYVIAQENIIKHIPFMKVNKFDGHLSDHCSLSWAILTSKKYFFNNIQSTKHYQNFPKQFKWDLKKVTKFQNYLLTDESNQQIKSLLKCTVNTRSDISSNTNELNQLILSAAKNSLTYKRVTQNGKNNSKKWYDSQLKDLKKTVLFNAKLFQSNPYSTNLRKIYFTSLTKYNKLRKQKARKYKSKIMNQLNELRTSDPSHYWNLLTRLKENFTDEKASKISLLEWESYFKKLNISSFNSPVLETKLRKMESDKYFCETDFKIKDAEIIKCIKHLKNKKAPGLDGIQNEMIRYSQSMLLPVYNKLFNDILNTGYYPENWRTAYITPIFKKGNDQDTNNYRGISIISNIAKLFNMIIQARVLTFLEENKLINEKQIAFKSGSRTSDHIFIVKSLTDKHIEKGKKLYSCFVDFSKAFDKINHLKLLYKLRQTSLGSLTYNIIKDMYLPNQNNIQVKLGNKLSNKFSSNIGVKQGDCLSPILFNFYINEIDKYIPIDQNTPMLGNKFINYLLYADDLVLFSTSKNGLQNSMDKLRSFCNDWDMEININKTKVLIFGKYRKPLNEEFTFQNKRIEVVESYKYLGIMINRNGRFSDAIKDLYNRSLKAMFKLTKTFKSECPDYNTCIHLFDHLVKPIMTYGSEIWGPFTLNGKDINFNKIITKEFEKCHQKFLRFSIGLNKRTPIIGLYGETGRYPIEFEILSTSLKYFNRITEMNESSLLHQCLLDNTTFKHNSWLKNIETLTKISLDNSNVTQNKFNPRDINQNLQSKFQNWWHLKLFDDKNTKSQYGNKLRNYRTYKYNFRKEDYLNILTHKNLRSSFAQLRLSSHKLHIETGRYAKLQERLPPNERLCKKCPLNICEDEFHFLIICPFYEEERNTLMNNVRTLFPHIRAYNCHELFGWLMANLDENVLLSLAKYVHSSFTKRQQQI